MIPERAAFVITTVPRGNVDGAEQGVSSNLLFDFYVPSTNVKETTEYGVRIRQGIPLYRNIENRNDSVKVRVRIWKYPGKHRAELF